jgi:arylsulfatase
VRDAVAEKLAANGLKFTRFHTCALCSPTRQAMLTGRNHHSVGMGAITSPNGVLQSPMEGTSMLYSFNEAKAEERHDLQYFEMGGNRGIYYKGWSAVTKHRTPWILMDQKLVPFDDDIWELYDGNTDWTQARNLATERPDMLQKLQRLFLIEATKYNVLPLDDRGTERFVPEMAGRPTLLKGNSQLFFPGMGRLQENSVVNVKNHSFSVTAEIDVRKGTPASGVIIAQGGRFGGWRLYAKEGRAKFVYNALGIHEFATVATEPIPEGKHQVRADHSLHASKFTGKIHWVQLDVGVDDNDHFISPEERLRIAMARQ